MQKYHLSYYVGPGNNSQLIQKLLQNRGDIWNKVSQYTKTNFRWCQLSRNYKYYLLDGSSVVNHFEYGQELANKVKFLINLHRQSQSNHINLYEFLPASFIIDLHDQFSQKQIISFLNTYIKYFPKNKQQLQKQRMKILSKLKALILNNYLIKRTPLKYIHCDPILKQQMVGISKDYLWIAKPDNMNCGKGLYIFSSIQQLQKIINQYTTGLLQTVYIRDDLSTKLFEKQKSTQRKSSVQVTKYYNKISSFIIQKYLEKPLLIHGRKFDIRVWTLLTHIHQLYIFSQGYCRTSSQSYSTSNFDPFTHFTNNSVQCNSSSYSQFESDNMLSYNFLQQYLSDKGFSFKNVLQKIQQIIILCFKAVKGKIDPSNRRFCFQIFGFDFIIDQNAGVWLIQANTNPAIQQKGRAKTLVPRMLDDAFRLTIDKIFNTRSSVRYSVQGYQDKKSMWKYAGDMSIKRKSKR